MQEQQALLLEDSPVCLAAMTQDLTPALKTSKHPYDVMQIMQDHQALLLEDSPVYLAAMTQDSRTASFSAIADAQDWGCQGTARRGMQAGMAAESGGAVSTALQCSRYRNMVTQE